MPIVFLDDLRLSALAQNLNCYQINIQRPALWHARSLDSISLRLAHGVGGLYKGYCVHVTQNKDP